MRTHEQTVQSQFDPRAEAYLTSAVHSAGPDLERAKALVTRAVPAAARALDLGCGGGHLSFALAPHVARMVALDPSPSMLATVSQGAGARGLRRIETRQGNAESLPFDAGAYGLVCTRYSAHHWTRLDEAVRELARVLAPGGHALVIDTLGHEEPARRYLPAKHRAAARYLPRAQPLPVRMAALLRSAGLHRDRVRRLADAPRVRLLGGADAHPGRSGCRHPLLAGRRAGRGPAGSADRAGRLRSRSARGSSGCASPTERPRLGSCPLGDLAARIAIHGSRTDELVRGRRQPARFLGSGRRGLRGRRRGVDAGPRQGPAGRARGLPGADPGPSGARSTRWRCACSKCPRMRRSSRRTSSCRCTATWARSPRRRTSCSGCGGPSAIGRSTGCDDGRSHPQVPLESAAEVAQPDQSRDPLLERRLQEMILQLPPMPRAVVLLRYQEDLDPPEIAEVLGMPLNTVKSHLKRSLASLRLGCGELGRTVPQETGHDRRIRRGAAPRPAGARIPERTSPGGSCRASTSTRRSSGACGPR